MEPTVFKMTLAALAKLGEGPGGSPVDLQFQEELARVIQDCVDRPQVSKPRSVTIKMSVEPIPNQLGKIEDVMVDFTFDHKCPPATSRPYSCAVTPEMGLAFSNDRLDNIRQATFSELRPKADKAD